MPLAFFILTQYRRVTDRRTDTLRSLLPALALHRAGKNQHKPLNSSYQHRVDVTDPGIKSQPCCKATGNSPTD